MNVNNKELNKKMDLFFYNNDYSILNIAGIICRLIILGVANNFFVDSKMYYLIFIFGLMVGSFGFVLEYYIKSEKRKALELEFGFFLYDLSKEYKKTNNLHFLDHPPYYMRYATSYNKKTCKTGPFAYIIRPNGFWT